MLLSEVKISIVKNMEHSYKMPDDDILAVKTHEALLWVATKCEPSELIRDTMAEADERVFRYLKDLKFIVIPEKPNFEIPDKHLMMDEALSYAVINFVCFLLSGEEKFKSICDMWIFEYRRNDLNGFLSEEIE